MMGGGRKRAVVNACHSVWCPLCRVGSSHLGASFDAVRAARGEKANVAHVGRQEHPRAVHARRRPAAEQVHEAPIRMRGQVVDAVVREHSAPAARLLVRLPGSEIDVVQRPRRDVCGHAVLSSKAVRRCVLGLRGEWRGTKQGGRHHTRDITPTIEHIVAARPPASQPAITGLRDDGASREVARRAAGVPTVQALHRCSAHRRHQRRVFAEILLRSSESRVGAHVDLGAEAAVRSVGRGLRSDDSRDIADERRVPRRALEAGHWEDGRAAAAAVQSLIVERDGDVEARVVDEVGLRNDGAPRVTRT